MKETLETVYTQDYKDRVIRVIEDSLNGKKLMDGDVIILYHWIRNQDDPAYDFVPLKYRTNQGSNKKPRRRSAASKLPTKKVKRKKEDSSDDRDQHTCV
jgi:hypothetical protein